jgi:hypothetical protein
MKEYLDKSDDGWIVKVDSPLYVEAVKCFCGAWGTTKASIFPGPQPVSIERAHFSILKKNTYMVCEKTDGVRTALMAFTFGTKKVILLINRALRMTYVSINLPTAAYKGTLLDCELIGKTLMVYDGVWVSGIDIKPRMLTDRLSLVNTFVNGILRMARDPVLVKLKTMVPLRDLDNYYRTVIPTLPYQTDGLIFTPVDEPVRLGTHNTMFKWKPRDTNTIDFQVKWHDNNKRCALYVQEKGSLIFESDIPDPSPYMDMLREDTIVECTYLTQEYPMWWKPIGVRNDKTYPNSRFTFYRTLVNIREDIQWQEFTRL